MTIQAFKKFCGNSAVSRTRRIVWPLWITLIFIQNSLNLRTHMGKVSESTLPRIFSMPAHSTFSLIDRNLYILKRTRSRSLLATFGAPRILSFSKVQTFCFCFSTVPDLLPDICGTLRGEAIIRASLRGTHCGFCKQLPVSTVPRASTDRRGLQPIITEECSWIGWCSTASGGLPVHSSVDIGLRICTGKVAPDSPVRS